jgi:hypothetical protein
MGIYSGSQLRFGIQLYHCVVADRVVVVKKSWDRLPACHFPRISDRLEAYPTQ